MAGIGFELKTILNRDSFFSTLRMYVYAGAISSGPWVIAILSLLCLGLLGYAEHVSGAQMIQFQATATYLIATSFIVSGLLQYSFTRYVADQLYMRRDTQVLSNFNGALLFVFVLSAVLGLFAVLLFFSSIDPLYQLLVYASFVVLCAVWLAAHMLSGLRSYKAILRAFILGYGVVIVTALLLLRKFAVDGLLLGFLLGHVVLLLGLLAAIYRHYYSEKFIAFDFLKYNKTYVALLLIGVIYNLSIWADKFVFWFAPATSQAIIGPLRFSSIYDLPIFLAYLAVIPGMAVFLLRLETDFVDHYYRFYNAIVNRQTLTVIESASQEMLASAKRGLLDVAKIQLIVVLILLLAGPSVLSLLHLPRMYRHIFYIGTVSASFQVLLLGFINIFFYFDQYKRVLVLVSIFLIANILLNIVSIGLGLPYYGYGTALALLVTLLLALIWLRVELSHLEYKTFMLQ